MNPDPDTSRRVPIPDKKLLGSGLDELRKAEALVDELHAGCCQPLRSPRMQKLTATMHNAQSVLNTLDEEPDHAPQVVALLEDGGAQLGCLQVACCSPARTKLYTKALNCLGRTQRLISRTHDFDH